jgi:CBS domain-containing protein
MSIEETIEFFQKYPPFNFLEEQDLKFVIEDVALEYYPRGFKILAQYGPPSEYLRLIKKGAVKVYVDSSEGEEIIIDYRSEGELFGFISLISNDRSRANVLAMEDTICYLIPKNKVLPIIEKNPTLNEYFLKSFFINFIDRTYEETRKRFSLIGEGERMLFTTPVGDIVKRQPVTANENITIAEAAKIMSQETISSLIILDGTGIPTGIITDKDLRNKVIAKGKDAGEQASSIMSSPLIRVDANEFCFEALLRMIRYNIHHILVIENGTLKGLVSNHDFMLLQGSSPTVLVKEIEEQQKPEDLAPFPSKLIKVVSSLVKDGARASNLSGFITEVIEKIINKIIDSVERKIGPSPLPYTLFFYGDGGRRELSLNHHFQLGIIYEDTHNLTIIRRTEQYFSEYGELLKDYLASCSLTGMNGKGDKFIRTDHIRSLSDWITQFKKYASAPFRFRPEMELFDMRAIRGDEKAVTEVKESLFNLAAEEEEFMDYIATVTVDNRPPLGFFKKFVVEKTGEHRNELNLYQKGIKPIIDSIRLFSIEKRIQEQSTIRRTIALKEKHEFAEAEDVKHVIEYLFMLLIHDQLVQIEHGSPPDDFVNPEALGSLEKKTLKESFQLIAILYDIIEKVYRTERIS